MPCACQIPVPKYPETADWGPILWRILHGLAERAGRSSPAATADEIREWQKFIKVTGEMLPCDKCRAHYSAFFKANPPTALSTLPFTQFKIWVRSWFFTLHNEVNQETGKPFFAIEDLAPTYASVNFQDLFWQLEPIMKKAIQLNGVSLMKWTNWVHSYKMLKSVLGV